VTPHYLRFVRALSLVAGVGAVGCSAAVTPMDGASGDVAVGTDRVVPPTDTPTGVDRVIPTDHVDPPVDVVWLDASQDASEVSVADAGQCPATEPTSGSPCTTPGLRCEYPGSCGNTCIEVSPGNAVWGPGCAIGPLPPPELAAVA
jgi:hypothetical protein